MKLISNIEKFAENVYPQLVGGTKPLSYSALRTLRESPYNFVLYQLGEKASTRSMNLGTAEHCLLLEGVEAFNKKFLCLDRPTGGNNLQSKDGRIGKIELAEIHERAAAEGKIVLPIQDWQQAYHTFDIVMNHPQARALIQNAYCLESRFESKIYGIPFHGYRDGIGQNYIFDVKRVSGLKDKKGKLDWTIKDNSMHLQAAIYTHTMRTANYYFIFLDDSGCLVYQLPDSLMDQGRDMLRKLIVEYKILLSDGAQSFCNTDYNWTN
jgi:hypothetical protein